MFWRNAMINPAKMKLGSYNLGPYQGWGDSATQLW